MKKISVHPLNACIVLLLFAGSLFGQGSNTVFQQMLSASTVIGPTVAVRNIGQQYHLLAVQALNAGTGTACATDTAWIGKILMEASFDGMNYFRIGVPVASVPFNQIVVSSASGAYAYVRVNYAVDGTAGDCALTAFYSGSLTGTLTGSAPFSTFQDSFTAIAGNTATSGSQVTMRTCSGGGNLSVYSLSLFNQVVTPNTALLELSDVTLSQVQMSISVPLAGYASMIWPQGSRPYMRAGALNAASDNTRLTINLSAATNVSWVLWYRCE